MLRVLLVLENGFQGCLLPEKWLAGSTATTAWLETP
jgi:hypothetical protein